jgi:hypothetical protein
MTILLTDIQAALRDEDIEGLIKQGGKPGEYDAEAKDIALAINAVPKHEINEARLIAIMTREWAKAFHLSDQEIEARMHPFRQMAHRLMKK